MSLIGTRARVATWPTVAAGLAAALALSGCGDGPAGGRGTIGDAPGGTAAEAPPSPAGGGGSLPAPPSPAPEPTIIRATGFLQAADAGNGGWAEVLPGARVAEARINPCGGRLPSDDHRVARAAVVLMYQFSDVPNTTPDGSAYEVISRYRGDGASAYLRDLRDAVNRCSTAVEADVSYSYAIEDSDFAGDESVLVSETATYDFEGTQIDDTSLIAAVRFGQLVIVIDADGWEMTSAQRADVDRLVAAALVRAVDA